ncbi:hypothetical protein ACM66B_002776 [Microbotryomycetes sp. NB124-2]
MMLTRSLAVVVACALASLSTSASATLPASPHAIHLRRLTSNATDVPTTSASVMLHQIPIQFAPKQESDAAIRGPERFVFKQQAHAAVRRRAEAVVASGNQDPAFNPKANVGHGGHHRRRAASAAIVIKARVRSERRRVSFGASSGKDAHESNAGSEGHASTVKQEERAAAEGLTGASQARLRPTVARVNYTRQRMQIRRRTTESLGLSHRRTRL